MGDRLGSLSLENCLLRLKYRQECGGSLISMINLRKVTLCCISPLEKALVVLRL